MKLISLLLLVTFASSSNSQTRNPFLALKFDKAIMYDYQPSGEDISLVNEKGQLATTAKIKKQVQIDKATIDELNQKVCDKKSYGQVTAMCFDPHLGIVYYLKGKIVRHILVCMDCNALRANIDIPAQKQGKQGEGNNVYYTGNGMSKSFRRFLNNLIKRHKFSHEVQPGSDFDW